MFGDNGSKLDGVSAEEYRQLATACALHADEDRRGRVRGLKRKGYRQLGTTVRESHDDYNGVETVTVETVMENEGLRAAVTLQMVDGPRADACRVWEDSWYVQKDDRLGELLGFDHRCKLVPIGERTCEAEYNVLMERVLNA